MAAPDSIRFISTKKDEEKKYDINIIKNEDKKCENLETLNLDDMNLKFVKDSIIQCNGIRHISLRRNILEEIPNAMLRNVPYLDCLNLRNNYINLYNIHTLKHQFLKVLDISYQNIPNIYENILDTQDDTIDEETVNIYKFMTFNTNSNSMLLPNLKYLDLSGNTISAITSDFNISFPQLTHLYLMNINAYALDEQFFQKIPYSLRVLDFRNNQLKNLELNNLANIAALYIDGNPFEKINITSLNLRILSVSNCTKLSTGIFNIPYLEQLDLSRNNLESITNIRFEIESLKTLLLDYNKLLEIPLLRTSQLLELSLSNNMIQQILPNRFMSLISLKKLSLKKNRIENIEKNAFLGLKKLEYLDLSNNILKQLPYDWVVPLGNLKHLNVNSNNFTSIFNIPVRYVSSLEHLSVKNNDFNEISTRELNALPNSTTLHI